MRFRRKVTPGLLTATAAILLTTATAPSHAIVSGTNVNADTYPFTAAIYLLNPNNQYCGGTLVTPTVVITAAHCLLGGGSAPVINGVAIGRTNLTDSSDGQLIFAKAWITHPLWNAGVNAFDVAAIKLWEAPSNPQPIDWATASDASYFAAGDTATALGWGATCSGCAGSDVLKKVDVPIRADSVCQSAYGTGRYIGSQHLCAGNGNGDTCQGDSGGPLVVKDAANEWILAGITSFGRGCNDASYPGVYTEVAGVGISDFVVAASLL